MAGASIFFDLRDLHALETALNDAVARAEDLSPLMDAIGGAMETTVHERFEAEEEADGTKWPQSIRAKEEGGQTLRDDGHLDNSITHIFDASSTEIGSNLIYAGPNFFGATIRAKNGGYLKFSLPGDLGFVQVESVTIPARNPLGIGGDDEETMEELAADYLFGGLAA